MTDNKQPDKLEIVNLIDPELAKAKEDGRYSAPESLWHIRENWALERADRIMAYMLALAVSKIVYCGECDCPNMTAKAILGVRQK